MKKINVIILLIIFICLPTLVEARRGCCSHHGGVAGCNSSGRQICNDGTLSPSCTCTPSYIYGCTDRTAKNYNINANKNDGSCIYYVTGCTNNQALNYNVNAEKDDGSCVKKIYGCMDKDALNYNEIANVSDDTCKYKEQEITNYSKTDKNMSDNEDDNTSDIGAGMVVIAMVGAIIYFATKKSIK